MRRLRTNRTRRASICLGRGPIARGERAYPSVKDQSRVSHRFAARKFEPCSGPHGTRMRPGVQLGLVLCENQSQEGSRYIPSVRTNRTGERTCARPPPPPVLRPTQPQLYHSAYSISNIPPNIRRVYLTDCPLSLPLLAQEGP
eukprot:1181255-Prorocentrum_minimum.AAC.3